MSAVFAKIMAPRTWRSCAFRAESAEARTDDQDRPRNEMAPSRLGWRLFAQGSLWL